MGFKISANWKWYFLYEQKAVFIFQLVACAFTAHDSQVVIVLVILVLLVAVTSALRSLMFRGEELELLRVYVGKMLLYRFCREDLQCRWSYRRSWMSLKDGISPKSSPRCKGPWHESIAFFPQWSFQTPHLRWAWYCGGGLPAHCERKAVHLSSGASLLC